jgi:membrane protein YqaA with SNARE-associated domain
VHTIILPEGLVAIIVEWMAAIADSVFALASSMRVNLPNSVLLKPLPHAGKHHLVLVLAAQRECFHPARVRLVHARHRRLRSPRTAKLNI